MIASSLTACLDGIQARSVDVEADIAAGLPSFSIVGLTDKAVQEARERVRSAMRNSGFGFPAHRLTVNLAPAELRKEGSAFDLAIAVAILRSSQLPGLEGGAKLADSAFIGELGLDGAVRPVRGALALSSHLAACGVRRVFTPSANAAEAAGSGLKVHPVATLVDLVAHLRGESEIPVEPPLAERPDAVPPEVDLAHIEDQAIPKRALEIAAAGGHHVLFTGPPGAGKSMLARAFAGLLPDLTLNEAKEVTTIHSIAGVLQGGGMVRRPPLRSPHHSISIAGLIGGGASFIPGDLTLAHRGVLVLDELPEFRRDCLEALREPLEEGRFRISRAGGTRVLPASFTLVATANPCPCGAGGVDDCRCAPEVLARYQRKLSGPLRDRLDLVVDVGAVHLTRIHKVERSETSVVRARVQDARGRQAKRQGPGVLNSVLPGAALGPVCLLERDAEVALRGISRRYGLTGRGFHGVLRVARSTAEPRGKRTDHHLRPSRGMRVPPPLSWRRIEPADAGYPRLLKEVASPPGLDVAGELRPDDEVVAIVGSRLSSPYGEDVAYEMAAELVSAGFVVASGLARGIDACAHRGALDAGGRTIAVMGTGRDRVYPAEHFYLARRIADQGALVTQFPPDAAPQQSHFPIRNQTLSGLSVGVVVVEAKSRSGAMLTAGSAADQGRLVMAVPGSVQSPTSVGCHDLLRDGAHLVVSAEQIVQEIRRDPLFRLLGDRKTPSEPPEYRDLRDRLLRVLRSQRLTLDQICTRVGAPARDVATAAAQLRLDGVVSLRDGRYNVASTGHKAHHKALMSGNART